MDLDFYSVRFAQMESILFRIYNDAKDEDFRKLAAITRDLMELGEALLNEVQKLKANTKHEDSK